MTTLFGSSSTFAPMSNFDVNKKSAWLFGDERELLAERVFSKLYGTRELHASKEGFTFHRPTAGGRHPLVGKTAYVCGQPTSADNGGAHFDQGHAGSGLQCIQSSTALLDQQEDDGCFLCWPGSHRHHGALTAGAPRRRAISDWIRVMSSSRARGARLETSSRYSASKRWTP